MKSDIYNFIAELLFVLKAKLLPNILTAAVQFLQTAAQRRNVQR